MKVLVVAFKPCWQDKSGVWHSDGGYPLQMWGICTLFDEATILVARRSPGAGGMPLPAQAEIHDMRSPNGTGLRRKLSTLSMLPYYIRTIRKFLRDVDVIHVPLPGDIDLIAFFVALAMRKRQIVRYSGSWDLNGQTTVTNRFTRMMMRVCAGGRNVMLATGEGKRPPARGIEWIFSSALEEARVQTIRIEISRSPSKPFCLGYVGRLSPEKGVHVLIEALARLIKERSNPKFHLKVMGEGPERSRLERMVAEEGLGASVEFLGQLSKGALSEILSTIDLCVQPSLTEGYSKAWLDAFVHGIPVLSSKVGAAPAVLGENNERGWLVPPGDVDVLAATIRSIIDGPVPWPEMRQRCRSFVENRTIEEWSRAIGKICARQWGGVFEDGKIRLDSRSGESYEE